MKKNKVLLVDIIIFIFFGLLYYLIELLYRGYSHWSMIILAGLLGLLIGLLDEKNKNIPISIQAFIGMILATIGEGITGLIVNVWLGLNVWNYSDLRFTFFYGQCNLYFCIAWFVLSLICIKLDNVIRKFIS